MLLNAAGHCRHRADDKYVAWGNDSETYSRPKRSMSLKDEKSSMVGLWRRRAVRPWKEALCKSRGRRRGECNFRGSGCQEVQDWSPSTTAVDLDKYQGAVRFAIASIKVPTVCLFTGCVSRPRETHLDGDLEGRHPVVVRCAGSLFSSNLLIAESDRSIVPISFFETYHRGSLPFRIDIGKAVRLVYHRGLLHRRCNIATTADAVCS